MAQIFYPPVASQDDLDLKANISSLADVALSGSYNDLIDTPSAPSSLNAIQLLASRLKFGADNITVGIASDSTGNDSNDWPRLFLKLIRDGFPSVHIEHSLWASTEYGAATVINAGEGEPESGGTLLSDTFTRTGELVGSTTDDGKVWAGSAGSWSGDGNYAKASALGRLLYNAATPDITLHTTISLVTTGTGTAQTLRIPIGTTAAGGGNMVFASIAVNGTGGVSVGLWKTIAGSSTLIGGAQSPAGIANSSATPQIVTLDLTVAIQNVTLAVSVNGGNATNITGTITESDYSSLSTFSGLNAISALPGFSVNDISMSTPPGPPTYQSLTVWNGSVAGTKLQYQLDRLAIMYPVERPLDVLIITTGHNYTTSTPSAFVGELTTFTDAFLTLHPETLILMCSQNPEFLPSSGVVGHKNRQYEVRIESSKQGWSYVPVFEAFDSMADGGISLVGADGIHPTSPPAPPSEPVDGYGSSLWAKTVYNQLISTDVQELLETKTDKEDFDNLSSIVSALSDQVNSGGKIVLDENGFPYLDTEATTGDGSINIVDGFPVLITE